MGTFSPHMIDKAGDSAQKKSIRIRPFPPLLCYYHAISKYIDLEYEKCFVFDLSSFCVRRENK